MIKHVIVHILRYSCKQDDICMTMSHWIVTYGTNVKYEFSNYNICSTLIIFGDKNLNSLNLIVC